MLRGGKKEGRFYDLCSGSGAITLELINQGVSPRKIVMVEKGVYGEFWRSIGEGSFNLEILKEEIGKLPEKELISSYLKEMSKKEVDERLKIYHYILMQSGSFGSKQIWLEGGKWCNASFRSYWKPTETSNRRSVVNPMMPMPETVYKRVEKIVERLSGELEVKVCDIKELKLDLKEGDIIYIDPPYKGTQGYGYDLDYEEVIERYRGRAEIYVSEGKELEGADESIRISKGRSKGNISGKKEKRGVEEWLNKYYRV